MLYKIFLLFLPIFLNSTAEFKDIKLDQNQTLRINFLEGFSPLHPHMSRDTNSATLLKALFEGLTRVNLEGNVELALARKIKISKCKTKYTIFLHPSRWSNGEQVTSDHFVNAWKAAIIPETRCVRTIRFFPIKNAEKIFQGKLPLKELGIFAPQKDQIVIHLEHPAPYFLQLLAEPTFSPLFDTSSTYPKVFNGPFVLKKLIPNEKILLKKNPLYFDVKNIKLNNIEISLISNVRTAFKLFQKGKLDFIGNPFTDLPEEIIQNSKEIKTRKVCAPHWIHLNTNHPKLKSKNIRKALSLAVDREYIANHILANACPNSLIITKELSALNNSPILKPEEKIQKLFAKGLLEIDCKQKDYVLTLSYTPVARNAHLAEYLKYQWEKTFGIQVILDKNEWVTFINRLSSRDFCLGGTTRYTSCEDPLYFLEYFYNKKNNYSTWENKKFKNFVDLANQSIYEKIRKKNLLKAEEILEEECPVIPIYTQKHLYLCNPNLRGFYPSRLAYTDFKWAYFKN
jgi:oligopeptide transport system substrate-binding protein